jgi:quercetin dioxygenase-like cupin family protein
MSVDRWGALGSTLAIVDNVLTKMHHLEPQNSTTTHAHTYDHITLLALGTVELSREEGGEIVTKTIQAPALIVTKANVKHSFKNVSDTDVLFVCIHAIRNGSGLDDVAPQDISNEEARDLISKFPLVAHE